MKHKIGLAFGLLSTAAEAQTFTGAPDAGTYTPREATYAAGTAPNVLGDGSDAKGGVAPAFTTHPSNADPRPITAAGEVYTDTTVRVCTQAAPGVHQDCDVFEPAAGNPYGFEKKARFDSRFTHFLNDDPIRFYGRPGMSHCHAFIGNSDANAFSTHYSLRLKGQSSSAGGSANSTGYWVACTQKVVGGKTYAIPGEGVTFYYSIDVSPGRPLVDDLQYLHPLLRFVWGVDMEDPERTKVDQEIARANAQPGTAGRYSKGPNANKPYGIKCLNGATGEARLLKAGLAPGDVTYDSTQTPEGTDPWEGRCVDGDEIIQQSKAPECWDGWNVSSPSGYDHFRDTIWDNVANDGVCPANWYKVPSFIPGEVYRTRGWDDYKLWGLSSDAMLQAKLVQLGSTRKVRPFESKHFDWQNGWNEQVLKQWQDYCLKGTGRTCNTNLIGPDKGLKPRPAQARIDTNDLTQLHLVDTTRMPHHNMKGM